MKYNIFLFFVIFSIIVIACLFCNKKTTEGFSDFFETTQEDYYKSRLQGNIPLIKEADEFFKYNDATQQLEYTGDEVTAQDGKYYPVDNNVETCKKIQSCDDLDNTPCGYCFYNDEFYYGDENGPKTDVCPGGWVKTKEDCYKRRERATCDKVQSCHEMTGEASICAWCPTKNKAYVYKSENGVLVPKYPEDECNDIDQVTGQNLGMILQKDCSSFNQEHPCVGPNEDTGPHSIECLEKLWTNAGCSKIGTHAPAINEQNREWWNTKSWKQVAEDMKLWHADAIGNNWNLAQTHTKGCLGYDPDPCDPKYGGRLECYQRKFVDNGCKREGKAFPTSKPDYSISEWNKLVEQYRVFANDPNLAYAKRNMNYENCYGASLAPPPPTPSQGCPVNYVMYGPAIAGNKEIPVKKIIKEGDKYVFITHDGPYTKIVKANSNLSVQDGFYYTGDIDEYETKTLNRMPGRNYNIKLKPSLHCVSNYAFYGPWINPNLTITHPVQKILFEGSNFVFLSKLGQYTKIVKADSSLRNQKGFYYIGEISEYDTKNHISAPDGVYNIKLVKDLKKE